MGLFGITITGADDATDPRDLVRLSEEFPFVEWGVLYSRKKAGSARYPTHEWLARFGRQKLPKASLHLCGTAADDALYGKSEPVALAESHYFDRVQINGWVPTASLATAGWTRKCRPILQARDVGAVREACVHARAIDSYAGVPGAVLYDPSGGTGARLTELPEPVLNVKIGYAGGIGPENIGDVLHALEGRNYPYWLDMESRVRTDERLDLTKVRQVLAQAAEHLEVMWRVR